MFHLLQKIPPTTYLACSGGIDSMVVLDFISRNKFRHIELVHINHGTDHGKDAEEFVRHISEVKNLKLHLHKITMNKPKNESWEEFWRNERYRFFHSFDIPIITSHHLNDAIEGYILSSLRGKSKLINECNGNVIRPFLLNPKKEFEDWAMRKNVEYVQDMSNFESVHDRNIIRNEMMDIVLKINPGIEKTVKKLLLKRHAEMV